MPDDLESLRKACEGLLYPSESDYPLIVFEWSRAGTDALAAVQRNAGSQKIGEIAPEQFFAALVGNDISEERREALKRAIAEHVREPRVFRVGAVEVRIFVIGRCRSGHWAGIRTISVET